MGTGAIRIAVLAAAFATVVVAGAEAAKRPPPPQGSDRSAPIVEFALRMFGHDVRIAKDAELQRKLTVDGERIMTDTYVAFSEAAVVAGVPILIGEHGQGGNACDVSRFLVSFPDRAKPRIDEPRQDCLSTTYRVGPDAVVVERTPSPSGSGRRWTWTPDRGFSPPETEAFVPADQGGWDALRSRAIRHPEWLFGYRDLADAIRARVPAISGDAQSAIIGGPGNVEYRGGYAIAFVCRAHDCGESGLLIVLDVAARKAWVALKQKAGPPTIAPPFDMWPAEAAGHIAHFHDTYGNAR